MHGAPTVQPKDASVPVHPSHARSAVIARLRAAGCVFAEDEADLLLAAPFSPDELAAAVERRVGGFPLEHILGWAEFCGLRIAVNPGVFVPRRRTEFLVSQAAMLLEALASGPDGDPQSAATQTSARQSTVPQSSKAHAKASVKPSSPLAGLQPLPAVSVGAASRADVAGMAVAASTGDRPAQFAAGPERIVVDLCCGSGAVATALAAAVTGIELHAADVDPSAVRCARGNVIPAGGHVHEGDLYAALPIRLMGRVDILAVNAPYVPTASISSMPHEARVHEPRVSLNGGPDGLDVQRRVIAQAAVWLRTGGHLLIETSRRQAQQTAAAMAQGGLTPRIACSEELDATVVIGRR
jgi:release factor glutamine methyltransferase